MTSQVAHAVDFIRGEGWTMQRGDKQSRRDECAAPNDTQRRRGGRGNCAVVSVCPLRACDNDSRQPAAAPARASFRHCHLVPDDGVDGRPKARAPPPPLWRVKSCHDLGKWSCQCEIGFGCVSPYRARGGRLKAKGVKKAKCSFGAIYWLKLAKSQRQQRVFIYSCHTW